MMGDSSVNFRSELKLGIMEKSHKKLPVLPVLFRLFAAVSHRAETVVCATRVQVRDRSAASSNCEPN